MEAGSKNRGTCDVDGGRLDTRAPLDDCARRGGGRTATGVARHRARVDQYTYTNRWSERHDTQSFSTTIVHVHRSLNILILYSAPFIASYWVSVLLLRSCTVSFGRSRVAGQHLLCL